MVKRLIFKIAEEVITTCDNPFCVCSNLHPKNVIFVICYFVIFLFLKVEWLYFITL